MPTHTSTSPFTPPLSRHAPFGYARSRLRSAIRSGPRRQRPAHPSQVARTPGRASRQQAAERLFLGARTLASLNVPGACPACFYVRLRARRDVPYQMNMPSILFAADRQVKEAVHRSIDAGRGLPPWMPMLGRAVGYVPDLSYKWFRHLDRRTNVSVCGVPDDLLIMDDGSVHVVDYKTATLSKKQREIMPLYEAQVSVYAYIAKRVGRRVPGPVRDLTLVYLEPRPDYDDERKLAMRFAVKAVAVPNHAEELVPELLARAREIMEAETCPRHLEGCARARENGQAARGADGGPVRGDVRALPQGELHPVWRTSPVSLLISRCASCAWRSGRKLVAAPKISAK